MSDHGYCFLASFAGTWCAIGLLVLINKIQKAVEEFNRSDYTKEQARNNHSKQGA